MHRSAADNSKPKRMKRLIFLAALLLSAATAAAQNYIVVDSEKIFKSIDAYNTAIAELDELAKQYQQQVDNKFAAVELLYNNYMNQKASLSASARQVREETILEQEQEAQRFQESLFGTDGTLAASEAYAGKAGADLVIDKANNPTLLYSSSAVDRTQQIIDALK